MKPVHQLIGKFIVTAYNSDDDIEEKWIVYLENMKECKKDSYKEYQCFERVEKVQWIRYTNCY